MNNINKTLSNEIDSVIIDLIAKYKELGMEASGKWAKTIEKRLEDRKGSILAEDYSKQLEEGRSPTSSGGDGTLRDRIEQWIKDKNITSELSVSSLAFLIARKIHREGWKREGYGGVNLISKVITPQRIQSIIDAFGVSIGLEFSEILTKELAA